MKEVIKILFSLTFLSCNAKQELKPEVQNSKRIELTLDHGGRDSTLLYIDDAKFKVYLKMCASPVFYYYSSDHSYKLSDSLFYGMLELKLIQYDTTKNGLKVSFVFYQGNKNYYVGVAYLPETRDYVNGVFYKGKALDKYTFIKDNITYDIPLKIDTALALRFYNNININRWFKKRIEDRLLKKQ